VPVAEVTWGRWLRLHPDTLVLSIRRDRFATRFTHPFDYHDWLGLETSTDPYLGYSLRVGVARRGKIRGLGGATVVLGLRIGGVAKAYPLYLLHGPIVDVVAGHRLRIVPHVGGLTASVFEGSRQLPATSGYWFAWQYFYPHTLLYSPKR
jgi:hypothetical protein